MNKRSAILLLGVIVVFFIIWYVMAMKRNKKIHDELRINNEYLIKQYLSDCSLNGKPFPIGRLGRDEVNMYWEKIPKLKQAREDFIAADESLRKVLMEDKQYREVIDWYDGLPQIEQETAIEELTQKKKDVYARLASSSEKYRTAREERDQLLIRCNEMTLRYMLDEYKKENKTFPVEWMGEEQIRTYMQRVKSP